MNIYKVKSMNDLFSKKILDNVLEDIQKIDLELISTNGLSGSKIYKIVLQSTYETKYLYLKVNNLKEDWVSKISNDDGRELIIFEENIYKKVYEFISGVYIAYYKNNESYAILMNDMSKFITKEEENDNNRYIYIDRLAKFHSKFIEYDVFDNKYLLDIENYYNFLSMTNVNENIDLKELNEIGWSKLEVLLGKDLFDKYNTLENIEDYFGYYPKTFLHGDYRPANTLYLGDDNIKLIDWANSGYGPCTLDLFWYIITSLSSSVDKINLVKYYKKSLEKYLKYKYTKKTWDNLVKIGILCACKMYLPALIAQTDFSNKNDKDNVYWWIECIKYILK